MAKYGAFKYGSGTLYGTGAAVATETPTGELVWILQIDWDGNGFSGYNEAVNMIGMTVRRGRKNYVRSNGDGLETISPGTASIELDDNAQRYDPYNAGSLLYPNVMPGKPLLLMTKEVATGVTYPIFYGNITNIVPNLQRKTVTITAEDGLRMIADGEIQTPLVYSTNTSGAIGKVLDLIGWKGQRDIKPSVQPVYVFDPATNENPLKLCQELAEANIGAFFMSASGKATFYPTAYNSMASHSIDNTTTLKEIQLMNPWETVRNKITVIANRRGKQPLSVIWSYPRVFLVYSGKSLVARFDISDDIIVPVPGVDFSANTAANGSGSDASASVAVVLSDITTTQCTVTVTNNYGSVVYISKLRITGKKIVTVQDSAYYDGTVSIDTYGPRKLQLDNRWLQDKGYAEEYANSLLQFLEEPSTNPTIRIEQRPSVQFASELLDYVALSIPSKVINDTFQVGMIEHKWMTTNGQSVLTTLYLQKTLIETSIPTPDRLYPGLPEVEEIENYNSPLWSNPYSDCCDETGALPPAITCLDFAAPSNGPYKISTGAFTLLSTADEANRTYTIPISATIRKFDVDHPTYIEVDGLWENVGETTAQNEPLNTWYTVEALNAGGVVVASGALVSTIGSNIFGTNTKRLFLLQSTGAAVIAALRFKVDYTDPTVISEFYATVIYGQPSMGGLVIDPTLFLDYQAHLIDSDKTNYAIQVGYIGSVVLGFGGKTFPINSIISRYGYDYPGSSDYSDDNSVFTFTSPLEISDWANIAYSGFNDSDGDPVNEITQFADAPNQRVDYYSKNYSQKLMKYKSINAFNHLQLQFIGENWRTSYITVTPPDGLTYHRMTVNNINMYNACA
jgi:hypothetical protein